MTTITSTRNPRVVAAARLQRTKARQESGRTLLEGPHLLAEAVGAGITVEEVFGLADDSSSRQLALRAGADWVPVTRPVLERIAPTETPRGPVAVITVPDGGSPRRDLIWTNVSDPGNAGTLIRTAAAFGLDVVLGTGAVDAWAPKVLRAGAGAHFRTLVTEGTIPDGWSTVATVPRGGSEPEAFSGLVQPDRWWAVLVGSEAHGLPRGLIESADLAVTIPMPGGMESLNASVAGAIVSYHLMRARKPAGAFGAPG